LIEQFQQMAPLWVESSFHRQPILKTVLTDYHVTLPYLSDSAIYALYPQRHFLPLKVRVFLDYLTAKLAVDLMIG